MSLTYKQKEDTIKELKENFEKTDFSIYKIANDLGTTEEYIIKLMNLEAKRIEDIWILKNYLVEKIYELKEKPIKFTALSGDYHNFWFLDSKYIDGKKIF